MNAPWWLAKVSAAWKRKHGPPDRAAREVRAAQEKKKAFGPLMTPQEKADFEGLVEKQRLADAGKGTGSLI